MHTDQQSLLVARKRPVGRPKTEGRVYASLKQCERSTGVPLSVLKILRNMSPEAFPPGGRVKWDKLNPGLKELAAMVSGNGGRDSKEELEKLYLKKRIEQTEAKTELFRDKYLDKEGHSMV